MNHTHSWRRYKKNIFYCIGPECFEKKDLILLHGKKSECAKCQKTFLIDTTLVSDSDHALTCPLCRGEYKPELTYEYQVNTIIKDLREKILTVWREKFQKLEKTRQELEIEIKAQAYLRNLLDNKKKDAEENYLKLREDIENKTRILREKEQNSLRKIKLANQRLSERIVRFRKRKKDWLDAQQEKIKESIHESEDLIDVEALKKLMKESIIDERS